MAVPGVFGTPLNGGWKDATSVFYESGGVWFGCVMLALAVGGLLRRRARLGPLPARGARSHPCPRRQRPAWTALELSRLFVSTHAVAVVLPVFVGPLATAGAGARGVLVAEGRWGAFDHPARCSGGAFVMWDFTFLKSANAGEFTKANSAVAARLAGRASRMLTDPALASPNKATAYRMRNVNGYEAFYPISAAIWGAEAEGQPVPRIRVGFWCRVGSRRWRRARECPLAYPRKALRNGSTRGRLLPSSTRKATA